MLGRALGLLGNMQSRSNRKNFSSLGIIVVRKLLRPLRTANTARLRRQRSGARSCNERLSIVALVCIDHVQLRRVKRHSVLACANARYPCEMGKRQFRNVHLKNMVVLAILKVAATRRSMRDFFVMAPECPNPRQAPSILCLRRFRLETSLVHVNP